MAYCPTYKLEGTRYYLRVLGASHANVPILAAVGGGLGLHGETALARNPGSRVAGRPRTGRQAGGRVLQPGCQAQRTFHWVQVSITMATARWWKQNASKFRGDYTGEERTSKGSLSRP